MTKRIAVSTFILLLVLVPTAPRLFGYVRWPPIPERPEPAEVARLKAKLLWEKARAYEEGTELARAARRYQKLVRNYPDSPFAPDALFRLGDCLEKLDRPYEAYQAYQKLLDAYPGKGDLGEILRREFRIAEYYLNRRTDLVLFEVRSGRSTAAEIFRQIVRNATFSEVSPLAQYNLAVALMEQGKYDEAELEFDLVRENYPDTPALASAIYQLGVCAYHQALRADYDQSEVNKAVELFRQFVRRYPDAADRPLAEEMLADLVGRGAKKVYDVARYYERKDCPDGALIYYQEVIDKFPQTSFASRAREKVEELKAASAGEGK